MKKHIVLFLATMHALALPGNLCAALPTPAETVEQWSLSSLTLLLTQFEKNLRIANKKTPNLTAPINDIGVMFTRLASMLELTKKPDASGIDYIETLYDDLKELFGEQLHGKKSLSVSTVRRARAIVRIWAEKVTKKILKNKAAFIQAGINPGQAVKIVEALQAKLGQRILNPSYAIYQNNVEKYVDHLLVKPFEWSCANATIVVPAALLIGFLAWSSQDKRVGEFLVNLYDPINETRIPVLRQSGASCGFHGVKNALAFAELGPVVLTDRSDPRLETFKDTNRFHSLFTQAKQDLTTLHATDIARLTKTKTDSEGDITLLNTHSKEIEAVRAEIARRIIAQKQALVDPADHARLPFIVWSALRKEDTEAYRMGLDRTKEQLEAAVANIPRNLTDAQIEKYIIQIMTALRLNIVQARQLIRHHTQNHDMNIFVAAARTEQNVLTEQIIAACESDNLSNNNLFDVLWPEAERNQFWVTQGFEHEIKDTVFNLVRSRKTLNDLQISRFNATGDLGAIQTACGGNWISGSDVEHIIESAQNIPAATKNKIVVWEQNGGGLYGNLPATMSAFELNHYYANGILTDSGRKIQKIVEFLDAPANTAHLVFVAGNGGHWIAINCTKNAAGEIVAQMADSLGSSPSIRQMVLNILRDTRVRDCWNRIQAAMPPSPDPGHVDPIVGE